MDARSGAPDDVTPFVPATEERLSTWGALGFNDVGVGVGNGRACVPVPGRADLPGERELGRD